MRGEKKLKRETCGRCKLLTPDGPDGGGGGGGGPDETRDEDTKTGQSLQADCDESDRSYPEGERKMRHDAPFRIVRGHAEESKEKKKHVFDKQAHQTARLRTLM